MFSPLALAQTFTIEGRVIDEENRGVAYANVILLSTDDESIISGTTTDDEGAYTIESVSLGTYIIRVSFIGYKEVEQQIELTQNRVLTPVILVEAAETLSEVEITVKKPTLTRKPDRLVFNVQST
ncbi:MAG: carboxypeptidase-like regulatory domain-containing protein, partial [Bacteroidia bacterium]|nr:carboxypeptidase-like regulatory domain-containing protein [Bacteroidia bacterium]